MARGRGHCRKPKAALCQRSGGKPQKQVLPREAAREVMAEAAAARRMAGTPRGQAGMGSSAVRATATTQGHARITWSGGAAATTRCWTVLLTPPLGQARGPQTTLLTEQEEGLFCFCDGRQDSLQDPQRRGVRCWAAQKQPSQRSKPESSWWGRQGNGRVAGGI